MSPWASAYLALLAAKAGFTLWRSRQVPPACEPGDLTDVWVVQPILSGDVNLGAVLAEDAAELAGARLIWLVDDDDPVGREAAELAATDDCRIVSCSPAPDGVNPKLWKLQAVLDEAPDDAIFVVLDDDTRLPRSSLGAMLAGLAAHPDQLTVATGLPAYLPAPDVWGRMAQQFVVNNAALLYLSMEPITLNGMAYAIRVCDLRSVGGYEPIFPTLPDDMELARNVLAAGGRIVQTASPQWITTAVGTPQRYISLMHRWFLMAELLLRRQTPATSARVIFWHGLHPLVLWVIVAQARRHPVAATVTLAVRAAVICFMQQRYYRRVLHDPITSVAMELAQPAHQIHAATQRTIRWRSRIYRVRGGQDFTADL